MSAGRRLGDGEGNPAAPADSFGVGQLSQDCDPHITVADPVRDSGRSLQTHSPWDHFPP